jgi:hypothetical protein
MKHSTVAILFFVFFGDDEMSEESPQLFICQARIPLWRMQLVAIHV